MPMEQSAHLQMPSFLYGAFNTVQRKAHTEGSRCCVQYQKDGSFPPPLELVALPPGEVVVAHDVVDFDRARPAWRLYMLTALRDGLCDALDWKNVRPACDAYEAVARETAWGALYFVFARIAPKSAEKVGRRLQAMLRFWEPLQSVRYLFTSPSEPISLEQLMMASVDWAMDAWCPDDEAPIRTRLEVAAARMLQATREDCIEVILRQMPRAFAQTQRLKHRAVLMDAGFLRERLAALDPETFAHVSGACTGALMAQLYDWDHQLGLQ